MYVVTLSLSTTLRKTHTFLSTKVALSIGSYGGMCGCMSDLMVPLTRILTLNTLAAHH